VKVNPALLPSAVVEFRVVPFEVLIKVF